jgi:prephenate dehydratase
MRIAIQGQKGSYHHIAAEHYFDGDIELVCCETFAAVFEALASHNADAGVIAAENSIAGTVHPVYDLLLANTFSIAGEVYEHIHHCLITLPDVNLKDIVRVYSHPMALPQCSEFLEQNLPHAERVEYSDTAASVTHIKQTNDLHAAAIASSLAAKLDDMPILYTNIEDYPNNVTRFLILDHSSGPSPRSNKSSLILETPHKPGALWHALGIFAKADINLTKLESRPIPSEPWRYQFLIDVETARAPLHTALEQLKKSGCSVRILGEYMAAASKAKA